MEKKIIKSVYEKLKSKYDWDMDNITFGQETFINDVIRETIFAISVDGIPDEPNRID